MKDKNPERKAAVADTDKNAKAGEPRQEQQEKTTSTDNAIKQEAPVTAAPPAPPPSGERRFRQTDLPAHFIERRKRPRISTEQPPPPAPPRFEDYAPIIGKPELDEIRFLARHLRGKTVKMVNSTALGGGVAEILNRLVPLMNELEIRTRWEIITGGNDFFEVTKGFQNALQGGEYPITKTVRDIFMSYAEQNRNRIAFDQDLCVINDPQPLGLVYSRGNRSSGGSQDNGRGKWIWRCHIDLSNPNQDVWDFLKPMVEQYDAAIFSSPSFAPQLNIP